MKPEFFLVSPVHKSFYSFRTCATIRARSSFECLLDVESVDEILYSLPSLRPNFVSSRVLGKMGNCMSNTGSFEPPGSAALRSYVQAYDDQNDPVKVALRRAEERARAAEKRVSTENVTPVKPAKPKGPKCSVCFKHCQISINPWQRTKSDLMVVEDSDSDSDSEDENGITEVPVDGGPKPPRAPRKPTCQVKPGEQPIEIGDMTARLVLGEANMDEWNHARFLSTLNLIYCPHKGCDEEFDADDVAPAPSGVKHAATLVQCPRCRGSLCKVCKSVWHENLTCEQYQALPITERAPEDVAFANLAAQEKWRRCPKCSAMVELKFGCNHITCVCKHHFCYTCGADFEHTDGKYRCKGGMGCKVWEEQNLLNRD
ncbi:RBR-type E3 ubiquitin transferase [Mycena venus]|uniref:RBR-type E3 ubiquitin transferase n=1 Tax=Mycena venus TaxID=2733690 RepID=A0A8H7CU45_9AGAR|nr:RBR-type E3 ubiquitin transferase [Mycena venus]